MKKILWLLQWILKAAFFFTLFAFALNNQQEVTVHFFFGHAWQAPLVLVLLSIFVTGLVLGILLMVPKWWRQHRRAKKALQPAVVPEPTSEMTTHGI